MDDRLGDADSIIRSRTILPYYLPFRTRTIGEDALARLRGSGIGSLKFQLGLLTSRFRAHHPLKACPMCMANDRRQYAVPLWHLHHQLPGNWICVQHDEPLLTCNVKVQGVERFLWHLPDDDAMVAQVPQTALSAAAQLHNLARAAHGLWALKAGYHFEPGHLLHTYLTALKEKGLATETGRLRITALSCEFAEHVASLRHIPELSALPASIAEAQVQLGRLFRLPRTGTHPLRHLVVICWLFPSWDAFERAYAQHRELPDTSETLEFATSNADCSPATPSPSADESSSKQTARGTRPINPLRPKRLHARIRQHIIAQLRDGADRNELARQMGFSPQTIARILRAEPGLQDQWHSIVEDRMRRQNRDRWQVLRSEHPMFGIKQLRVLDPAVFAWLYRNDRTWLSSVGAPPKIVRSGNHSSVSWDERDRGLAVAISHAALAFHEHHGTQRMLRRDLLQRVPDLAPKIRYLGRLPLTVRALMAALSPTKVTISPTQGRLL